MIITEAEIEGDILKLETDNEIASHFTNGKMNTTYSINWMVETETNEVDLHLELRDSILKNNGKLTKKCTDLSTKK